MTTPGVVLGLYIHQIEKGEGRDGNRVDVIVVVLSSLGVTVGLDRKSPPWPSLAFQFFRNKLAFYTVWEKGTKRHDIPTRRDVTMPTLGLMMKDPTRMVTMKIPRRHRTDVPTQHLDLFEELDAYSQPGSPRKTS